MSKKKILKTALVVLSVLFTAAQTLDETTRSLRYGDRYE